MLDPIFKHRNFDDRKERADAAMEAWQSTLAAREAPARRREAQAARLAIDPSHRILYSIDTVVLSADIERVLWQDVPDGSCLLLPRIDTGKRLLSAQEAIACDDATGQDYAIISINSEWFAARSGYVVARTFDLHSPGGIPQEAKQKELRGRGRKQVSFIELAKPICLFGGRFLQMGPGEWPRALSELDQLFPGAFKNGVLHDGKASEL